MSNARVKAERRGHNAERMALFSYMLRGYRPLARRFASPAGEIDLILRRGRMIVFAEVKSRGDADTASAAITAHQQKRIANAARVWLSRNPSYNAYDMRFDAVLVTPWRMPHHIPNAFGF